MAPGDKPLQWLAQALVTPPVSAQARREAGLLLRRVQRGESMRMPDSRPMPGVGRGVHELRVRDPVSEMTWRIVYRIDPEAILVVHWWAKKSRKTAQRDIDLCQRRLRAYDRR